MLYHVRISSDTKTKNICMQAMAINYYYAPANLLLRTYVVIYYTLMLRIKKMAASFDKVYSFY